ncbi:Fur family transcriptional regulator [Leeuwenhoekiella palythoae]|uniref:Fur family ferric uptake transcriptional regulator n=1 Tax=Leeuwenhoekiella palythoae TaxID=573501 RepID=A0A1M5ZJ85_9FLAO|nr:transcriptional repressor [Leeuwenhoekiella palythoae]HAX14557.1 transcriptional repressor [Leeuwenhoekiella sp.]RXG27765.1 Fur family ferric uptake transcriptional regulator [Leeuwenhoekiella palythoae]UBZ09665.1 transcriptional repressor [Leeuwenhoekiella palythoae]SHI24201.1 Fur family transcriptional regulator, ferric uptake regulator [Leeuwenhoekiella palythoae]HBO29098.1 transcriptional repressor [Leeuwenhoekiella sp.]
MKEIESTLQNKGIRPTAMRMLIYKFMAEKNSAQGLSDLELAFTKADRTTVYRTLKTFEEKGVVHQIDDGTGVLKYALCEPGCRCDIERDLHLHFHCNACDKTICLTEHKIPHINLPDGFIAEDANLVVKGICDSCSTY